MLVAAVAWVTACGGSQAKPATGLAPEENGTGSTRTIENRDHQFVESVQEMLRGRVSGVQVIDHPACGLTVRIRGMSDSLLGWDESANQSVAECDREPLLIIDNKPIAPGGMAQAFETLQPQDIDRIQVLKDVATTSVYGTRGAFGVILITTSK